MVQIITKLSKIPDWVLILIITLPTFITLLRPGFFPMQDDLQAFRLHQMDRCFADWQIPCRFVPDAGYQYGYPLFNFYSPSVFYLGELFHLLGLQFIDVVKLLFILGFILSAFSMYLLLRSYVNKWVALFGTISYIYNPVRATEVYVRGALNEFWSLVFFPLIFWSSKRLIETNQNKYWAFLSLSLSLLLTTHNIMSMLFIPLSLVWVIINILLEKKYYAIPKIIAAYGLGIGLSAFFVLPMVYEKDYVHLDSLLGGYFDYRQHFVTVKELFFSNQFGYGSSQYGPIDEMSLSVGVIQWIVAFISIFLALIHYRQNKKLVVLLLILVTIEVMIVFLMHQKSSFIWEKIPILVWLQFPWRLLTPSSFLLSLTGALLFKFLGGSRKTIAIGIVLTFLTLLLSVSYFHPKSWLLISDKEKFSNENWEKQLTISIFDYLPIYAKLPPNKKAPDYPEVLSGEVEFISFSKRSNYQRGQLLVKKEAQVRLPLFDFPGMQVKVDGQKVRFNHDNCTNEPYCFGLITFTIPTGMHIIEARLNNTEIRTAANLITVLSLMIWLLLLVKSGIYARK